jgi:omega-hydroxy-beta-dihydromenaquinone-9 sulfotransferase
MTIFHPSIFYVHTKTIYRIIQFNIIENFSVKRFLFTSIFLFLHAIGIVFIALGRILDEIFFPGYRKTDLSKPVFIISNPRCGTTFLHRLLCLDGERYTYTYLYHTIFPCITFIKLIQGIAFLDSKIGGPLNKFFKWLDERLFGGWKDIHPMGFSESEEDEALFTLIAFTPALILLTPWANKLDYLNFLDKVDDKTKQKIKQFYISSLKRIVYATNPNATLLMKNVFSTGRLNFILDCFPNAKIIYPVRHPYNAVPSVISMFTGPWNVHSPEIKDDSEECRAFGNVAIGYYAYLFDQKDKIKKENLLILMYDDVVKKPKETTLKIYDYFGFEVSDNFMQALSSYTSESRKYKSKHSYSLAQYGIKKEDIYEPLKELMDEFGFDKNKEV